MKGIQDLMKQAQQMQEQMQDLQREIQGLEATGESGAGLISVTMNGAHEVRRVTIDPSLMQEDKTVLEDLIAAACNDAARKVERLQEDLQKEKMGSLAAGLNLPPGFKLPF